MMEYAFEALDDGTPLSQAERDRLEMEWQAHQWELAAWFTEEGWE